MSARMALFTLDGAQPSAMLMPPTEVLDAAVVE
jgi:hypothetical protein